jgi:hypothetical protein
MARPWHTTLPLLIHGSALPRPLQRRFSGQVFHWSPPHRAPLKSAPDNGSSQTISCAAGSEDLVTETFTQLTSAASSDDPASALITPALSTAPLATSPCAVPYLHALLSCDTAAIKGPLIMRKRRAHSVPPPQIQCFSCLATDRLVAACPDPVRYRSCLRYGHQSLPCSLAGSSDPYPRWFGAVWSARRSTSREGAASSARHTTPLLADVRADWRSPTIDRRVGSGTPPATPQIDSAPALLQQGAGATAVLLFASPAHLFTPHQLPFPSTAPGAPLLLSSPTVLLPHQLTSQGMTTPRSTCPPWTWSPAGAWHTP